MLAEPLVRIAGLGKAFGGALVLDRVTMEVRAGEAVALMGANGAGKTTLLRILATLVRPSRGTAAVAGFDCVKEAEGVRRHIAIVAHGAHVYDDLTALENLHFWTTMAGRVVGRRELCAALEEVELDGFADDRVRAFSVGMKRRLTLARLVLVRPSVMLLDEPFAGLDQRARKWLDEHLRSFKEAGGAALMATHSFSRDLAAVDRVTILAAGSVALDTPRASLASEDLQRLYMLHTESSS